MALVIDGTTLEGYWKIYDDGTPTDYAQVPKGKMYFNTNGINTGFFYFVSDFNKSNRILTLPTDTTTKDHEGNLLDTSAKVCEYLSNWR